MFFAAFYILSRAEVCFHGCIFYLIRTLYFSAQIFSPSGSPVSGNGTNYPASQTRGSRASLVSLLSQPLPGAPALFILITLAYSQNIQNTSIFLLPLCKVIITSYLGYHHGLLMVRLSSFLPFPHITQQPDSPLKYVNLMVFCLHSSNTFLSY